MILSLTILYFALGIIIVSPLISINSHRTTSLTFFILTRKPLRTSRNLSGIYLSSILFIVLYTLYSFTSSPSHIWKYSQCFILSIYKRLLTAKVTFPSSKSSSIRFQIIYVSFNLKKANIL